MEAPFATLSDYRDRSTCPELGHEELIETLLSDASQFILDMHAGREITASADTLRRITVAVVQRSLASVGSAGVESIQQGAGPYQETVKMANPSGDMYLTKLERRALGIGTQVAYTVAPDAPRWRHPVEVITDANNW